MKIFLLVFLWFTPIFAHEVSCPPCSCEAGIQKLSPDLKKKFLFNLRLHQKNKMQALRHQQKNEWELFEKEIVRKMNLFRPEDSLKGVDLNTETAKSKIQSLREGFYKKLDEEKNQRKELQKKEFENLEKTQKEKLKTVESDLEMGRLPDDSIWN